MGLKIPTAGGGVNLLDDPRNIRDDEVVKAKNLVPYIKGMLQKRPGLVDIAGIRDTSLAAITGLISPFTGVDIITSSVNTLHVYYGGNSLLTLDYLITAPRVPVLLVYTRKVYAFPGGDSPTAGYVISIADAAEGFPTADRTFSFAGTNNTFSPAVAAVYRGRVVYAGLGPGYENHLVFSDPNAADTIGSDCRAANGRAFTIDATDGDRIVALVEITQGEVGTPIDRALLVLKEYSAYILTGEPNITTDATVPLTGDMVISRINYNCGCSSPQSVARTPYGTIWASHDDVWSFVKGSLPVRIGTKIQPKLKGIPAPVRYRMNGTYFNGFYRLALYSEGLGPSADSPLDEQWWLDLRDGSPQSHQDAKWWGPQTFSAINDQVTATTATGINYFVLENRTGYAPNLYAGVNARLMQCDIPTMYDGQLSAGLVAYADNQNTEITCELLSKEYDAGFPAYDKSLISLKFDYWTNITDRLSVSFNTNGGATQSLDSITCTPVGFQLSADSTDDGLMYRQFQKGVAYPATRIIGTTFQVKIYNRAGYIVGPYNDTVVVLRAGTYYAVTLGRGSYNLKDLLDELVAKIAAAVGISCAHDTAGPGYPRTFVTLTLGAAVTLNFVSAGGAITAAQLKKSRVLMGTLGWDTSANSASSVTQAAGAIVYWNRASNWNFADFDLEFDVFQRGPA